MSYEKDGVCLPEVGEAMPEPKMGNLRSAMHGLTHRHPGEAHRDISLGAAPELALSGGMVAKTGRANPMKGGQGTRLPGVPEVNGSERGHPQGLVGGGL